ncbi:MAG: right-handed parallel beta-helix repeat-containing protein, partial [Planctomycetota bacterium]
MRQATSHRVIGIVAAFGLLAAVPAPAGAAVQFEQAINGSANGSFTFTLQIDGGTDQFYVMCIAVREDGTVTSVTGGEGLTWTERLHQCADGSETSAWIFTADGSPSSAFSPTVNVSSGLVSAVCLRYSGVGAFEDPTKQNINGESGACTDATDDNQALLTLTSTVNGSVHLVGLAPRNRGFSTSGWSSRQGATTGGGPNTTTIYALEKTFDPAATDQFQATLDGNTSWATAGIVLAPTPAVLSMSSASNQTFDIGDPPTAISAITITDGATPTITAASDIRITIPAGFNMTWDATDTTATIVGSDVSSTVTYEDSDATLVLDVTGDFVGEQSITVSDLSFKNFTAASAVDNLEVDVDNNGTADATDSSTIRVSGATGTIFYVRKSGSDSNNGESPANAWLTIDKAANTMIAGEWVYVGAGVYDEQVTPTNSGTAADPIRFIADTDGSETGDAGTVEITESSGTQEVVLVEAKDYIEFVGFKISGGLDGVKWDLGSTNGLLEQCEVTGSADRGIDVNTDSTLTITDCDVHTVAFEALYVHAGATATLTGTDLHDNGKYGMRINAATATIIASECRIYSNGSRHGIYMEDGSVTLTNCLLYDNDDGINLVSGGSQNLTLWHCTIDNNPGAGILQDSGASTITNCIITNNGGPGLEQSGGTMNHTENLVWNNNPDYSGTSADATELSVDPLFVSAADRHLQSSSPAKDAGTDGSAATTVDFDGQTRPRDAGWDMGYDEYGPSVIVAISSEDNQTFGISDPDTAASPITVTDAVSPQINFIDDIRISIPVGFNMTWDTTDTQAAISGPAASNMSTTVSYEDAGQTLVLDVTTDFSSSDMIVVSGLSLTGFGAYSAGDNLELDVGNDSSADALDDKTIRIGASGNTYYVRQGGLDAAPPAGTTPATAWATISHAAQYMFAGDWVYVGAGTYEDQFSSSNDGTPADPIRFIADTDGSRTGDAGVVEITDSSGTLEVLQVIGNDYYEFIGFRLSGGNDTVEWSGSVGGRLEDCEVTGAGSQGVFVSGASELTITGCNINGQTQDGIWVQDNGTVRIVDTVFQNNGRDGVYLNNGTLGDNATVRLERCLIDSNLEDGVDIYENYDVELVNCLIRG